MSAAARTKDLGVAIPRGPGVGIWLTVLGGVVTVLAGINLRWKTRDRD
jgi:hypothetical protein